MSVATTLHHQDYLKGCLLVLLSAVCYGLQPLFAFYAYNDGASPIGVLLARFCLAALIMFGWIKFRNISLPDRKQVRQNLLIGAGYATAALGYYNASHSASFSMAIIVMFSFPAFVTLFSILFLKERLTRIRIVSLTLAISGVIMAAGTNIYGDIQSILWALLASVSYGSAIIYGSHKAKPDNPIAAASVILMGGSLISLCAYLFHGVTLPESSGGWSAIAGLACFATLAPVALFISGSPRIGASNAATLSTLEPVVAVMIAVTLLGENFTLEILAGGALVIIASVLLARKQH
ncbi:DMT family transporter [Amphritea balenae]|uniref:EamA/RhaT family transporter n=1 Tax=Amphritea balenae TaxID=452629 RepID=A0A3P1SWI0_9GAMM|nr:DMT family transporter [Amphritea balenae]RRD01577.1 EamA/RhaT family transporter [Amphritea balenae]GGK55790.1 permease [Amphritea balenae]